MRLGEPPLSAMHASLHRQPVALGSQRRKSSPWKSSYQRQTRLQPCLLSWRRQLAAGSSGLQRTACHTPGQNSESFTELSVASCIGIEQSTLRRGRCSTDGASVTNAAPDGQPATCSATERVDTIDLLNTKRSHIQLPYQKQTSIQTHTYTCAFLSMQRTVTYTSV